MIVLTSDASGGFQAIADEIDPTSLAAAYHEAVGGVLNQHGWNLAWFGNVTLIGSVFIWRENLTAIWVTGLIGGLADLGYLLFVDLLAYVNFVPGTVMTLVSGSSIVLSFWVLLANRAVKAGQSGTSGPGSGVHCLYRRVPICQISCPIRNDEIPRGLRQSLNLALKPS